MTQSTTVTRSRLPLIAIAVWLGILSAIIAIGLAFGGQRASVADGSALAAAGGPGGALGGPIAAAPSASPGTNDPATGGPGNSGQRGPRGFAFGRGGPRFGGPGAFAGPNGPAGRGPGRGPISISGISGSQLSLKTDDGWTRTIDATGATITDRSGATLTLGDLKVGDHVGFRETRNADGTYTINAITRIPPETSGTVKSVDATGATITLPDGSTQTIGLTGSTTYTMRGKAATAANLTVGTHVHALGTTDGSGGFTATTVDIAPAMAGGVVAGKTGTSITVTGPGGGTITINVNGSTTYATRGNATAGLADIAVGDLVTAEGALNPDGSLTATTVRFGHAGPAMMGNPGMGGGFGQGKGRGFGRGPGGGGAKPNPSAPAASPSAG
jgi:hypothetical protein